VNKIFALRLIIEKWLSYKTPLVPSFADFQQWFNSVDRRDLAKVLSLHGILYMDIFDGLVLRSKGNAMGDHGIKWGGKKFQDFFRMN